MTSITSKHCRKCARTLPVDRFSKHSGCTDGLQPWCKECHNSAYAAHPEKILAQAHAWLHEHPRERLLTSARNRAKYKGLPFNITVDDIQIPERCPVFGMPLNNLFRKQTMQPDSPSIDRIIPELGYVKGNIVIVSWLANRIKSSGTPEQWRAIADFYAPKQPQALVS